MYVIIMEKVEAALLLNLKDASCSFLRISFSVPSAHCKQLNCNKHGIQSRSLKLK